MDNNETTGTVSTAPGTEQIAEVNRRLANAQSPLQDANALVLRAATARTRAEMLAHLSKAVELDPDHPVARQTMYQTLKLQLEEDAFLGYLSEDDRLYQVRTANDTPVTVTKERAVVAPYPPLQPDPFRPALRWLMLVLIGLLPSGLGALVLAPRALFAVTNLRGSSLSRQDRHRRLIFAMLALGVWFLGILLSILALVHLL